MKKRKKEPWVLPWSEVGISGHSGGPKLRTNARQSRAMDLTSAELTLSHNPTGISVTGNIAECHYSRKDFKNRRQRLQDELYAELQCRVAARLGIKGR